MKIMVTGANGLVGAYLCRDILKKGWRLTGTGSSGCRLPFADDPLFTFEKMELTDAAAISSVIREHQPDVLIHSAAMSRPDECEQHKEKAWKVNVEATVRLLEQAEKIKATFLFLSTDFVFDGQRGNYSETVMPAPVNYYGQTKLAAEKAVIGYRYTWAIIRTILVYGRPLAPRPYLLSIVEEKLRKGESYAVVNDQRRAPTYVEDLSSAIITMIQKKAGGIYHISGEDLLSPYEMARRAALLLDLDTSLIIPVASESLTGAVRPPFTSFDLTKAKTELNYQPLSFEEGLHRTLVHH